MPASSDLAAPCLLPIMRYRDLAAAVDWLCEAFGFEKQVAVNDADGNVFYAQVSCGGSMIMLGAVRETDLDKLMRQPDEVGGAETQSCYLVVEDIDTHYARAKAAGAEIVLGIRSDGLGRRGYSCRDPQGHIWNFGTYNPWKGRPAPAPEAGQGRAHWTALKYGIALAVLGVCVAAGTVAWLANGPGVSDGGLPTAAQNQPSSPGRAAEEEARTALSQERLLRQTAQNAAESARRELALERTAKGAAERTAEAMLQELARERTAREAAERATAAARDELARDRAARETAKSGAPVNADAIERERRAREAAEAKARTLEGELAAVRSARDAAMEAAAVARAELEKERTARQALEREAQAARQRAEAAERQQTALIETSATERGDGRGSRQVRPARSTWTVAAGRNPPSALGAGRWSDFSVRRPRRRLVRTDWTARYPPTYLTTLREVPWPYNIWYRD